MRFALALLSSALLIATASAADVTIKATNKLNFARANQTVELSAKDLSALNAKNLDTIHVKDSSGKELLVQAIDTDYDDYHKPDMVIFQSDFGPAETKTFTVSTGKAIRYTPDEFKAYGRFVRERFDDFAWENDRIAHRSYGKALETWKGEPLTSSSIDIWSKRTPKLVIDRWYMAADYHADHGEGYDDYSAGATRGCGGDALWADNKLWPASNFVDSRVLANGPIRVLFELDYEPFDVNGKKVAETRRISLDAGSNLDRFECTYKPQAGNDDALTAAIGIRKVADSKKDFSAERGTLTEWQKMEKNGGMQGIAVIADPKQIEKLTEDSKNDLLLVKVPTDHKIAYSAGFFWDKAKQFDGYDAWNTYVQEQSQCLTSPIEVTVGE
jgi:formylmethanofuran dehydrogenase subunit D